MAPQGEKVPTAYLVTIFANFPDLFYSIVLEFFIINTENTLLFSEQVSKNVHNLCSVLCWTKWKEPQRVYFTQSESNCKSQGTLMFHRPQWKVNCPFVDHRNLDGKTEQNLHQSVVALWLTHSGGDPRSFEQPATV